MASVEECRQALQKLADRLAANAAKVRSHVDFERTLACRVTDLDTAFHGKLSDGRLVDLADGDDPKAKIAISALSDDLVALVNGELDVAKAITSRRVSIHAGPLDLLKLRKLL